MINKEVRIAVAGIGLIGLKHIEAIQKAKNVKLVLLIEKDKERRENLKKYNLPLYKNIITATNHEKIDGMIISTPNTEHLKNSIDAINSGCNVLIEKPISTHSTDVKKLIKHKTLNNVEILVGHHRRHNPIIKKAKEIIDNGELGELKTVHINCLMHKPNQYFKSSKWRTKKGSGPILVNLIHDIDLINFLCGDIISVQSQLKPSSKGFENEEVAGAILRFKNGMIGSVLVSDTVASPWSWELTARENEIYPSTPESCYQIGGSVGSMSLPNLTIWKHQGQPDWYNPMTATKVPYEFSDPLVNQINHFAEIIRNKTNPIISAETAMKTLMVIEAIHNSSKTNQIVEL